MVTFAGMHYFQDKPTDSYRHKGLRKALVRTLESKGIADRRVLEAIERIPRHYFFDSAFVEQAYKDIAFPIGQGQTISQPYTVARQTELLELKKGEKVLEIGTGSGYQCCVLMEMGVQVFTIEVNKVLFDRTLEFLPRMGYKPKAYYGDGTLGLPLFAPFDKIIVTAGAPVIPESLLGQLNTGGMLVIPVGDGKTQMMMRLTKLPNGNFNKESFGTFSFVKLVGAQGWN